ncbi:MAG: NAD(+) diphosphatase [Pseudomonadota bacterium]
MTTTGPGLTGSRLDRADHLRADPEAYAAVLGDWRARVLTLEGLAPAISDADTLVWGSLADVAADAELVLLGLDGDRPHFVEVVVTTEPSVMRSPAMFHALTILPAEDAATFATALSLITWHNNHRFCARCGSTTTLFRAGWGRKCDACNTEHFPRTDPVVIMLAEHSGRVLVGRQSRFPPGNYSALAGFLEPGESIEEAVRREVKEEAGITCGAVRYVASQPWPFGGAQLMIACIAEALDDAIVIDERELEDAMWVTRDDARAALAGEEGARFRAPPPFAIAHTLLRHWVAE